LNNKWLCSDPIFGFVDGLKDVKVKYGDTMVFTAKVMLGPSKELPTVKW